MTQLGLWDEESDRSDKSDKSDKSDSCFLGGLLGFACGDALGAALEGERPQDTVTEINGRWGERTETALATLEAILASPEDPLRALNPKTAETSHHDATGNASLPRALPAALAYSDPRTLLLQCARLSALTHWNPQAEVCCATYALWIHELLTGTDRYAAWREAIRMARDYEKGGALALDTPGPRPLPDRFWHRLENVTDLAFRDLQASGYAGYCLEALEAAAWCAIFAGDAEQAVVDAANLGGAAASLGALAGGAAGVHWGAEGLPERWLARLAGQERIELLAERLHERSSGEQR